jgi:hypothetical protein
MRHRGHGAADVLDLGAGTEGFSPCGTKVGIDGGDGDESPDKDEEEEDGPAVDPYLREPSSKAEVWG